MPENRERYDEWGIPVGEPSAKNKKFKVIAPWPPPKENVLKAFLRSIPIISNILIRFGYLEKLPPMPRWLAGIADETIAAFYAGNDEKLLSYGNGGTAGIVVAKVKPSELKELSELDAPETGSVKYFKTKDSDDKDIRLISGVAPKGEQGEDISKSFKLATNMYIKAFHEAKKEGCKEIRMVLAGNGIYGGSPEHNTAMIDAYMYAVKKWHEAEPGSDLKVNLYLASDDINQEAKKYAGKSCSDFESHYKVRLSDLDNWEDIKPTNLEQKPVQENVPESGRHKLEQGKRTESLPNSPNMEGNSPTSPKPKSYEP